MCTLENFVYGFCMTFIVCSNQKLTENYRKLGSFYKSEIWVKNAEKYSSQTRGNNEDAFEDMFMQSIILLPQNTSSNFPHFAAFFEEK